MLNEFQGRKPILISPNTPYRPLKNKPRDRKLTQVFYSAFARNFILKFIAKTSSGYNLFVNYNYMHEESLIQNLETVLGFPRAAQYFFKSLIWTEGQESQIFYQLVDDLPVG